MGGFVLAAMDPAALDTAGLGVGTWWRTIGGLTVVFGLLFMSLKLLSRYGRRGGAAQARLLTVWHLGPRREIQVLRLGDDVSYVYRHDNAMVLVKQESWDAYRHEHGESAAGLPSRPTMPAALARWLQPLQARLTRPGT